MRKFSGGLSFSCKAKLIGVCFVLAVTALLGIGMGNQRRLTPGAEQPQAAPQSLANAVSAAPQGPPRPQWAALPATQAIADKAMRPRLTKHYGELPLSFEANQGQTDSQVKFLSRGRGATLFLNPTEAVLALHRSGGQSESKRLDAGNANPLPRSAGFPKLLNLPTELSPLDGPPRITQSFLQGNDRKSTVLRIELIGSNPRAELKGLEELPGKSNYFIGNNPRKWHTNVPNYRKVALQKAYPGIDLVYYGNQRQLEFDFVIAPGADLRAINLAINGAQKLMADDQGDLIADMDGGELRLHKPVVYQEVANTRKAIEGRYIVKGNREVAFQVGVHDQSRPLVLDPVLSFSTYLGGSDLDAANGIAVDSTGSVFVAGETDSADFPTAHPLQPETGGPRDFPDDAFVAKISADGSTLIYSTFLGGSREDRANGIAVDAFGSAYVTGTTISEDFPATIGAADPNCGVDGHCDATTHKGLLLSDAFISKLNAEGSALVYSTFFGHPGPELLDSSGKPVLDSNGQIQFTGANDLAFGIAVDNNGNAYVTGTTDFAILGPLVVQPGVSLDAFIVKVSESGGSFLRIGDFGGTGEDQSLAIAVDGNGNAYVTGITFSADFPILNAFQGSFGGDADAFVAKFDTTVGLFANPTLRYSTFLGGSGHDQGKGIAVDSTGKIYVTGVTSSTSPPFPTTPGVLQTTCKLNTLGGCDGDAFVAKIDPTQSGAPSLVYSTYLGGTGADTGAGIAVDTSGNAYVTGFTNSPDFPTSAGVLQAGYGGGNTDAFVAKLNPAGSVLGFSSYLGGSNAEDGRGIAVDRTGNVFVTGQTCSTDFPTASPLQPSPHGNCDAFVAKIAVGPSIALTPTSLTFPAQDVGTTSAPQTVTVDSKGDAPLAISNISISGDFAETNTCTAPLPLGSSCTISVTFTPTAGGTRNGTLTITDNAPGSPHRISLVGGSGAAFSVSASPTSAVVTAGQTASFTLTVTPASGFTSKVTLRCDGAPRATNCSVSPAEVSLDGVTPSITKVTVTTSVRTMVPPGQHPNVKSPPVVKWVVQPWLLWLFAFGILSLGVIAGRRRAWLVLAATLLLVMMWAACAGGTQFNVPSGTPAGTFKVTLTGQSGALTRSTTVTLTVN